MKPSLYIPYVFIIGLSIGFFVHFGGRINHTIFDITMMVIGVTLGNIAQEYRNKSQVRP